MTIPNKQQSIEYFKKYGGWVLFALLLLVNTCNRTTNHSDVIALRDKENVTLKNKVDSLLTVNKSKDKIIEKSEKKVAETNVAIHDLNKKILAERQNGSKIIAQHKTYELADWKKYYQERSGFGDKYISMQNTTLNFTKEPLVAIANDLVKGDIAKSEVKFKNEIIAKKDTIIGEKEKIILTEREKGVNLTSALSSQKEITENLKSNISDLQTDLKKARRPQLKPIIIATVLGGITGAILAK